MTLGVQGMKSQTENDIQVVKFSYDTIPKRGVRAIVPLYRNAHLVDSLVSGILACRQEFIGADGVVMFVNDSPEDVDLDKAILSAFETLSSNGICIEISKNEKNLGFIKSANKGLSAASACGQDALLLNSDVVLKQGCLSELRSIAYVDSMIGFVCPRSNNASICSFPHPVDGVNNSNDTFYLHRAVAKWMPRFHYVPTAVGFCLYIKYKILSDFGFLDEVYGLGYNEENDLVMRANRSGYRAAIANWAYAYHLGSASFGTKLQRSRDRKNFKILNKRYPEYLPAVKRYLTSAQYLSEKNLVSLIPDFTGKIDLGIDLSSIDRFSGEALETARRLLMRLNRSENPFRVIAICSHVLSNLLEIDNMKNITHCLPEANISVGILLRVELPDTWREAHRISMSGALNVYYLIDSSAWDCAFRSSWKKYEEGVWNFALSHSDGILFNSRFTRHQCHLRFTIPEEMPELVVLPSTHPNDYIESTEESTAEHTHILVVGNRFPYQFVFETVTALLEEFPDERIVAVGIEYHPSPRVTAVAYGNITENKMNQWFRKSACVIITSSHEGMIIPAVRGTAYDKSTYLRLGPLADELREHSVKPWLLHTFETAQDLILKLKDDLSLIRLGGGSEEHVPCYDRCVVTWENSATEVERFLTGLLERGKTNSLERIREFEYDPPLVRAIFRKYIFPIWFIGPTLIVVLQCFRAIRRSVKYVGKTLQQRQ